MHRQRTIKEIFQARPTREGAGVHLHRVFGFSEDPALFDPFLLLDDFRSDHPDRYSKGFPWHPHRGIETITYMLRGTVEHGDSMGNRGTITAGDVQWMTAGSGIIHQEMPAGDAEGAMHGFQLWANLPASHKMMAPRYRDVRNADIPVITGEDGTVVRIIAGTFDGTEGPVRDIVIDPRYFDITVPPESACRLDTARGHTVFCYIIEGTGYCGDGGTPAGNRTLVLFDDGDTCTVTAGADGVRFLFVSGKPLGEPVAWRGPIVMNTEEELQKAFEEYREGTFIKDSAP